MQVLHIQSTFVIDMSILHILTIIVQDPTAKYNTHIWKQCHFKYNTPQ
jgi:hypothetical protein